MATEVGQLTVKVDTSQVKKATDDLEDMAGAAGQAEAAVGGVGTASSKAQPPLKRLPPAANDNSRAYGQMGRSAGMAAIQVEQLAGQVAMGQNPMRALGVQAADLGFILGFPLLGAVVGVTAAIVSMIPSMLNADKSAEDLAESMAEVGKIMSVNAKTGADELSASFVKLASKSRDLAELSLRVQLVEALNNASAASALMADSLDDLRVRQQQQGQMSRGNARALREFSEEMGITQDEALNLRESIDNVRAGNEGATESFIELLGSLARSDEVTDKFLKLAGPVLTAALNLQTAEEQAAFLKATLGDLDGALEDATNSTNGFAASQERAASALQEMLRLNDDTEQRSLNRQEDRIARMQKLLDDELITQAEFDKAKTEIERSGEEERARIRADAYQKRQEALEAQYIAEQDARAIANAAEVEAEAAKEQAKKDAAQARADGIMAIENVLLKDKSEKQKAGFAMAVGLMDAEKRERAKAILSKSYDAAMGAYSALAPIPIIGPALGAAAAAAIMVQGAQMAAKSLAGRSLGGQVQSGQSYVVGERGPEILTMGNARGSITPNEAIRGGQPAVNKTANVSFNIQANDTAGFDELLLNRRGLIINVINEALNDQGRASLA
jgi:hypothetical protein